MSRRAHIIWAIAIGLVVLAAFVAMIITIKYATQDSWLCAHHWRAC